MPYYKTKDNVRIFYKYRKRKKPTLIFVHGIALDHTCWGPFLKEFNNYGLLCFDIRGHGKSSRPKGIEHYKIEKLVEDLDTIIKKLKIKNYYLIGFSLGGMIVSEFITKYKPRYSGAVLISTPTSLSDLKKSFLLEAMAATLIPHNIFKIIDNKKDFSQTKNKFQFYIKALAKTSPKIALTIINNLESFNGIKKIKKQLIIVAANDEIINNNITKVYKDYKTIKGSHTAPLNDYKLTSGLIEEFICKNAE